MKHTLQILLFFIFTTAFAIQDTNTEQYNTDIKAALSYCGFNINYIPRYFQGNPSSESEKDMQIAWDRFPSEDYLKKNQITPKGIIVLVTGKGESYTRYAELFYDFRNTGYIFFAFDNRGAGFSSRFNEVTANRAYIDKFDNYVYDLKIFMEKIVLPYAENNKINRIFTLSQSLGSCIAARFLEKTDNTPDNAAEHRYFDAAVFCSPMFDEQSQVPGWTSGLLARANVFLYCGDSLAWGEDDRNEIITYAKADRKNTSSADRYNLWEITILGDSKYPGLFNKDIGIGGVTWKWLREVQKAGVKAIDDDNSRKILIPILVLQAGQDTYVNNDAEDTFCGQGKDRMKIVYPDAHHNIMMENDAIRGSELKAISGSNDINDQNTVIQNICNFFNRQ